MAHPLEGHWHSTKIKNGRKIPDGDFFLDEIDGDTGNIINARHELAGQRKHITMGNIAQGPDGFAISMTHENFGAGSTNNRIYDGLLVADVAGIFSIIVGSVVVKPKTRPVS